MEEITTQEMHTSGLRVSIQMRPGSAVANVLLNPGESFTAEAGAMIAMSNDMEMSTTTHKKESGSIIRGLKRMISGESFFLNHFKAGSNGGNVYLGTSLIGDMFVHELHGESIILQGGSYVASSTTLDIDLSFQGFKNLISKEGLFWLKIKGNGTTILNSFGAVYEIDVDGSHIVDTGHIVAFEETLNFTLSKAGKSWISSILGGEGLVCKFNGKGKVWVQSHNTTSFGSTLGIKLKPR